MDADIVESRLKAIAAKELCRPLERVTLASELRTDLGADSLDVISLTMAIEQAFGIEIPDADVEPIVTVLDMVKYVEKRLENRMRKT